MPLFQNNLVSPPFASTNTQVAQNAASVALVAENSARMSVTIVNESADVLYVREGAAASATQWAARLTQYASYVTNYTGAINGIWAAAGAPASRAQVTDRSYS